MEPLMCCMH